MLIVKGRENINLEKDGYIYIFQKDYNQIKFQEDEEGELAIDVSDIFKNARKWKWGIYTDKYYSVLLSAFVFKIPKLIINVPNALISIKKDQEFISINALIFAKDKELAFRYANEFKISNRESIAFEFIPQYYEKPLKVEPKDIFSLLETIEKDIKEIKETTKHLEKKTQSISFDTRLIKQYMEKFEAKFHVFEEKLQKIAIDIKTIKDNTSFSKHKVSEDENTIYIVGSVFNYLKIDDSFYKTFRIKNISNEQKEKIHELVKEKYFKGEKYITGEELKAIGIKTVDDSKSWRIVLSLKEEHLNVAVNIFSSLLKEKSEEIEKAFRDALVEAVNKRRELSIEDIEERLSESARKSLKEIKDKFKGKKVVIK